MSKAVDAARQMLAKHWDMTLPVNPFAIAAKEKITVTFPPGMTDNGSLTGVEDGKPVISINPNLNAARQRFTLFHELGHYALKHGGGRLPAGQGYPERPDEDEREEAANQFAAEMIMPEMAVRLFSNRGYSIPVMARLFAVSERAMNLRLGQLNMLEAS